MSNIDINKLNENVKDIKNIVQEENKEKSNIEDKYGDDELFEPWADVNIFFPIATKLVDPLHCMGMTPNMVTITSTIFTIGSIILLHQSHTKLACASYLFGYLLDCVDGRMARKYSMGSDIGMALDSVSDNISNFLLIVYILLTRNLSSAKNIGTLGLIFLMTNMLSLSYGLNEAISAFESTGDDNFYEKRVKQLEGKGDNSLEKLLYWIFLKITHFSYVTYKKIFPTYDREKINNKLKILKHFGPGNFCLLVGIILLYI